MPGLIAFLSVVYGSDTDWFGSSGTDFLPTGQQANGKIMRKIKENKESTQEGEATPELTISLNRAMCVFV